jgi:hypothetical protein
MSASAQPAAAGRLPRRVLLVHANPFQRVTPVPAYGLERLRTAIEPTGAEVMLIDPFLVSEDRSAPLARRLSASSPISSGSGSGSSTTASSSTASTPRPTNQST